MTDITLTAQDTIDLALIQRWKSIVAALPKTTQLLAVSKHTSHKNIQTLLDVGQVDFGEARPQNLRDRAALFPQAHWHMIGPLQKNKAKYVGKFAYMWHSLCDIATAEAVAKHVKHRVLPVLIQVNISGEPQKQGVTPDALQSLFEQVCKLSSLRVVGLMGMAAKGVGAQPSFALLRQSLALLHEQYPGRASYELCIGMSSDWRIAIKEESTMIRVGTEIFGTNTVY